MNRYLQITFVPHVENGWNFFMWLTNKVGEPQFFPDLDDPLADFPDWLTDESYKLLRTSVSFVSDDQTETVFGALVTMESLYRMIKRRSFSDTDSDFALGETVQWFRQIAQAIQVLLENGHFYPTVFHLDRGNHERCYFGQWMPDVRFFEKSGLFSDRLGRLPQLAFSIADLQSVKVQQWLYLIVIYWTDALIRFNIDPYAYGLPETMDEQPAEQRFFFDSWLSHLADDPCEPFAIANNPKMMANFERFEAEISHWVHPIAEAQPKTWMDALKNYRRDQQQAFFSPERIILYLDPLNEDEPFAPGAEWEREIFIHGWQNNEEINVPLEQLLLTREFEGDSWFKKQLDKVRTAIPDQVIDLIWHHRAYTFLAASDVFHLYEYRDTFAASGILLEFPERLAIRDASQKVDVDLKISTEHSSGESLFGLSSLINYNWRIAIGDIELTADEFKKLVKEEQAFIKRGNEWIHLPLERMMKAYEEMDDALELMDAAPSVAGALQLKAARQRKRNANIDVRLDGALDDYLDNLLKKPKKNVPVPEGFHGRLRPYQKKGYTWLANLREKHVGGCLADDMGLGKTIQAIAYLGYCQSHQSKIAHKNPNMTGAALVICPTSLLANWKHEFAAFAPNLNIYMHHGPERFKNMTPEHLKDVDVMITSYTIYTKEAAALVGIIWSSVILDEAQAIKNPQAKKTRALRHIKAAHRLVLTGTPIENRLEELWSIMDFLNPGYLGTLKRFKERFIQPIEKKNNKKKAKQLTKIIQPFLLRREKTDKKIIQDLPDKVEIKEQCFLSKDQASLYQSFVNHLTASVARTEGIQRKGLILSTLTKLKQVCDHPSLVLEDSAKPKDSGKLDRFFELIEPLFENNEKVLVFTQYVKMGHLLASQVQSRYPDATVLFLHGSLTAEQREKMVRQFQVKDGQKTLFVLSLKAGGVGLNLTEASHVIHYDRWWNPAVEEQATDRAYRIGQHKNVHVYKLVCEGTLEERIDELIEKKKGLTKQILGKGESWLTEMSDQDIYDLIKLRERVI